jgi:hypothetical protein
MSGIPSGNGSEVLKRKTKAGNNNGWFEILSGEAHHIYTVLSIIFVNRTTSSYVIEIQVNDGSSDVTILGSTTVGSNGTFIYNDKFVMEEDDDLDVYNGHSDGDWYVSYIEQDWS